MKTRIIFLLFCCSIISGCGYYRSIAGTVIDAETLKPIEGAVVMVEWTKHEGFPLHHTISYKVIEVTTDKNGKVAIEGLFKLSVEPPDVAIYKPGYVTWSSRAIFPSHKNREDFSWGDYTFKLERFKPEYSYVEHGSFFSSATNSGMGESGKKSINDIYDATEREKFIEEMNQRSRSGGKR